MNPKRILECFLYWIKSYRRTFQTLLLSSLIAGGVPAWATIDCTVNWSNATGQTATSLHYGLGVSHGFNGYTCGKPGDSTYKANVAYMKPGIIRYHNAAQINDSTNDWFGWIAFPTTSAYAWDRTKISNALAGAYAFGPEVMMNIVRWPAYLNRSSSDERLQTNAYSAFASFCADLVRIVNIEQGKGVKRWEILNEPEAHGYYSTMDEAARAYCAAAVAMKAVDPTIKVGGPAFGSPENSSHRTKFISTVFSNGAPLDFVTYHQYPDYADTNFTNRDSVIWNQASALGGITTGIRSTLQTYYGANAGQIETFLDEYNINWIWDPAGEPRMATVKGAVWDALAMIATIKAGATGALTFNEGGDSYFGKLDASWNKRPGAHVGRLFNETQIGEVIAGTTSDTNSIVIFAQRNVTNRQFCLVNRSGTSQTVRVSFSGWLGGYPGDAADVTLRQVGSSGIATTNITLGGLSGSGISLPADTVSFFVTAEVPVPPTASFTVLPAIGTVPLTVSFTDTSGGTVTNRYWDFGDGTTTNATATNVSHTYSSAGTNTVTLIVSGPAGTDTNTQTGAIIVTAPVAPSASFTASPASGTAPLPVTFTDTSTGTITNRYWNFGDGNTANTISTNVAHTYTAAGTNTVTLIVSGPSGASTNVQSGLIGVSAASTERLVRLDLSGSFDYDGFVTDEEIAYATGLGQLVAVAIGDHADDYASARPGNGYSHIVTPGQAVYKGIATNGIVDGGNFELAKGLTVKWGAAAGNTKVANSVARFYDNATLTKTATITLTTNDQKKYSNLNILVNGSRYATLAGTMSATLSVKYTGDDTWYTVWTESASSGLGGVFGGEWSGGQNSGNSYQSSAWTAVTVSDGKGYAKVVGGLTVPGSGSSYMYKLTTPAVLDETKVLESFRMEAVTYNKSRVNELQLFAASGTEAETSVPVSAPIITGSLLATGTVGQAFSYQIAADNTPVSFNATGLPPGLSINTNSGAIIGTPTVEGSNSVTISASNAGGTDSKTLAIVISPVPIDNNGNGIPDAWETQYGITNSNPNSLSANGINTILESYIAGLNPTNPSSRFGLSVQQDASQSLLQWSSVSGRVYSVYWTTNLLNGFQPQETNIVWPQNSWTDAVHSIQGSGYYHIGVQLYP